MGYMKNETVTLKSKLKQLLYHIQRFFGLLVWTQKMVANMLPRKYSNHLKTAGFHDCTHAYAITLDAAKKLVPIQTPVIYRSDDLLSHTILAGNLKAFVTEPKFFDQESSVNPGVGSEIR
jgi:glycosyl transferase family 25